MKANAIEESGKEVNEKIHDLKEILDIGCCSGYLTSWYALADSKRNVVGVDRCARSIRTAKKYAERMNIKNVRFECMDVLQGLPDGPYDAVVETQTVSSLSNQKMALKNIKDVLKPDGNFVSVPLLPTAAYAEVYLRMLREMGLVVKSASMTYYSDFGDVGMFPVFVASPGGNELNIDLDEFYSKGEEALRHLH